MELDLLEAEHMDAEYATSEQCQHTQNTANQRKLAIFT